MAESKEEWRASWWKWKKRVKTAGLRLNIQKTKVMVFSPITSQKIDGGKMEMVANFVWGAPKSSQMVTTAMKLKGACSLEEKL